MKVLKTKIHLKGGQEVSVYLKSINTESLQQLSWENATQDLPGIVYIRPEDISMITTEWIDVGK